MTVDCWHRPAPGASRAAEPRAGAAEVCANFCRAALKERMPYVADTDTGKRWITKGGAEALGEMLRIYNDWLADFCATHPDRFAGLASIPNHDPEAAAAEIERVARRGVVRGLEIVRQHDATPLWDTRWNPVWKAAAETGLPLHFHTIGGPGRDFSRLSGKVLLAARAASITTFQIHMADVLLSIIFAGVLERHPNLKVVIGEAARLCRFVT